MTCMHVALCSMISNSKMQQKKTGKNHSFPDISTQLGLKKTISVAEKWTKHIAKATTPLEKSSIIKIKRPQIFKNSKILDP